MFACVLRDLGDGTGKQYVPLNEAVVSDEGEKAFVGSWRCQTERHGPSGSHSRTVCLPASKLAETSVAAARAGAHAAAATRAALASRRFGSHKH